MGLLWFESLWEACLLLAVLASTTATVLLCTLPSHYSHFRPQQIAEDFFTDADRKDDRRSGYASFCLRKDKTGKARIDATVQVVVLGDIGRSPRMQYHALSIAAHGGKVDLVGYVETAVHPDIQASRMINVVSLRAFPKWLQTSNKLLFLFLAPLKVLWQIGSLYYALGYSTEPCTWMLVQNPPSIPTLAVAQVICFIRNTRLIVDWHNFGYSILAMRLGDHHPLVRVAQWYEGYFAKQARAHFAVTNAMVRVLKQKWNIEAMPLHDRPANLFQPLSKEQRFDFLRSCPETKQHAEWIETGATKLLVSSTSWTADEDFSVLLEALIGYSAKAMEDSQLPRLAVIITGKGPQKVYYLEQIRKLKADDKLANIEITTAWLTPQDYASLLGSADVGISLHTSSSGVDLPMKVVDMLGTGLPVLGWSAFEAWTELIHEGENGRGFSSAQGLTELLFEFLQSDGKQLKTLRAGALKDCQRRWDDEWMPIAGQLFNLK